MEDVLAKLQDKSLLISCGLVAGEWKNGQDGKKFPVYKPFSATKLQECANLSRQDFLDAMESAKKGSHNFYESNGFDIKEPVGVCGIVSPWNFPAAMITRKIAPAFAAGCSVIIKPPSETPFGALRLAKLALAAGIPSDTIHVVPTKDRESSMELANNPLVKKLSFTGSTGVGKMLTKTAAGTMKRVSSMELGANAPFIVFDAADIDQAVEGALMFKLLVHEKVQDEFIEKLVQRVGQYKLGRGIDKGTTQGPLVNAAGDAVKKGAVLPTGGKFPESLKEYFHEPTVISGVTIEMEVAHDETFGPLAAIMSFTTEAGAVELANATGYGLARYLFSKNISRVMRVARRLKCGMLGVNTGLLSAAGSPFGGVKESGLGREGSMYGLAEYQNVKSVAIGNLGFN